MLQSQPDPSKHAAMRAQAAAQKAAAPVAPAGASPPSSAVVADPSSAVVVGPSSDVPPDEEPLVVASPPELLEEDALSTVASTEPLPDDAPSAVASFPFEDVASAVAPSRSSLAPSVSPLLLKPLPLPEPPLPPLDPESLSEAPVHVQGPKAWPSALHTWAPVHPLVAPHDTDWPGVHRPAEDPELPQPAGRAKTARSVAVPMLVQWFIERFLVAPPRGCDEVLPQPRRKRGPVTTPSPSRDVGGRF